MRWFSLLLACGWLAICGCGSHRRPGQEVAGTVLMDGKPLAGGSVVLVPVEGGQGPKCYALVEQGRFHIPASEGPLPGKYRVEVYSASQLQVPMEELGPAVPAAGSSPPVASRFNVNSRLIVEIRPDAAAELKLEVTSEPPAEVPQPASGASR